MAPSTTTRTRPLRRDARENRDKILAAAKEVFAEKGLSAGVDAIAQRAGVGTGTLYRHFPSKEALIAAVFERRLEEIVAFAEEALAVDDPWDGFCLLIQRMVAQQHDDRGLKDVVAERLGDEYRYAAARQRIGPPIEKLLRRAQDSGAVRQDIVFEDVSMLFWALGELAATTRDFAPGVWRRYVALFLDGLRTHPDGDVPLPHPPLTRAQHRRTVAQWVRARGGQA